MENKHLALITHLTTLADILNHAPPISIPDVAALLKLSGASMQGRAYALYEEADGMDPGKRLKRIALASDLMTKGGALLTAGANLEMKNDDRLKPVRLS